MRADKLPGLVLAALVWVLFGLTLRDTVPGAWMWLAFPAALICGWIPLYFRFRSLPAVVFIGVLPWLAHLGIAAFCALFRWDFIVVWDNSWLLTAPLWYLIAFGVFARSRSRFAGYFESLVLSGVGAVVIWKMDDWELSLSLLKTEGLRLGLSLILLILAAFCFWAGGRHGFERIPRNNRSSRLAYSALLAMLLVALVLSGNAVRRSEILTAGGGILSGDLFRFDFGDVLSLEPRIELNPELTMIYREDGASVPRYLRRYTLSGWDEKRGFFRDGEMETDHPEGVPRPAFLPPEPVEWLESLPEAGTRVEQEYYLIALDPDSFFALNRPVEVEPWTIWDDASFVRGYGVESQVSVAGPWELFDSHQERLPEGLATYLLEGGDDAWFRELAERVVGDEESVWARAMAIEQWLRTEFYYSLSPGLASDGDQLRWFLEESRRGYCSYFAFAMTRLCRAVGIPARVAVGFLTDVETSVLGFVPVRADQAHAWVEVWMGEYGWITFDPTSSEMAPGEDYPMLFISPDEWMPLIEEVLARRGEVSVAENLMDEEQRQSQHWWRLAFSGLASQAWIVWPVVVLFLIIVYAPYRFVPGVRYWAVQRFSTPRKAVKGRWRSFAARTMRAGYRPGRDETPLEWAVRLEGGGLKGFSAWTREYLKAEFSPIFDPGDAEQAEDAGRSVLASWRTWPRKVRLAAFLSPGWRHRSPW